MNKNRINLACIVLLFILVAGVIATLLLSGCSKHKPTKPAKSTVKYYRPHPGMSDGTDLLWFMVFDNGTYYYASTPPQATVNMGGLDWKASPTPPQELNGVQSEAAFEAPTQALGPSLNAEMNHSYDVPEANSLDSMEGVPDTADSSSSGDSGSVGGDSGGDAGGGDGGGGE